MACLLRADTRLTGLPLPPGPPSSRLPRHRRLLLSAFADDTLLFLGPDDLPPALEAVQVYCGASGARLNWAKCQMIQLGRGLGSAPLDAGGAQHIQTVEKTCYLGAQVGRGVDLRGDVWGPVLADIQASVQRWKGFGLTLPGRARVARTMLLSKLWYLASCFAMPDDVAAEAESWSTSSCGGDSLSSESSSPAWPRVSATCLRSWEAWVSQPSASAQTRSWCRRSSAS